MNTTMKMTPQHNHPSCKNDLAADSSSFDTSLSHIRWNNSRDQKRHFKYKGIDPYDRMIRREDNIYNKRFDYCKMRLEMMRRGKNISSKRMTSMFKLIDGTYGFDNLNSRNEISKFIPQSTVSFRRNDLEGLVATMEDGFYEDALNMCFVDPSTCSSQ
jgi:hypothetical protein